MRSRNVAFKDVEVKQPFTCNQTLYRKASTRTGTHQNGRTFYFAQDEVVTIDVKEEKKA